MWSTPRIEEFPDRFIPSFYLGDDVAINILFKQLKVGGFIVSRWLNEWEGPSKQLAQWIKEVSSEQTWSTTLTTTLTTLKDYNFIAACIWTQPSDISGKLTINWNKDRFSHNCSLWRVSHFFNYLEVARFCFANSSFYAMIEHFDPPCRCANLHATQVGC